MGSEKKIALLTTLLARTDTISLGHFVTNYISNNFDSGAICTTSETTSKVVGDVPSKNCGTKNCEMHFNFSNDMSEYLSDDISSFCDSSLLGDLDDALDALKDEDYIWNGNENNSMLSL